MLIATKKPSLPIAAIAAACTLPTHAADLHVLEPTGVGYGPYVRAFTTHGERAYGFELSRSTRAFSFQWDRASGIQAITGPPYDYFAAYACAADGSEVAGTGLERGSDAGLKYSATRWDSQGTFESLGRSPLYVHSEAVDISADGGTIVGNIFTDVPQQGYTIGRPFYWTAATGRVDLPHALGGDTTFLYTKFNAVSADGRTAVGHSGDEASGRAFRWTLDSGYQFLSSPLGASGAFQATDISGDGAIVVGMTGSLTRATTIAAYWDAAGVGHVLDDTWSNMAAHFCNGDGSVIVGNGRPPNAVTQNWIWTSETGIMTAANYLRSHGVALPADYTVDGLTALSADGMTFGGGAISGDRQSGFFFIATVPTPGTTAIGVLAAALITTRRRRPTNHHRRPT